MRRSTDVVAATPVRALANTLDQPDDVTEGSRLPELWHWLCFLPLVPTSELGADGHPRRGGFLPPVPLERRMWAGGRVSFLGDLRVGDELTRTSTITAVEPKEGRAGQIVLVALEHVVEGPRGVAVQEEQDLVYVPMPTQYVAPAPNPLPDDVAWTERHPIDPVLLFRFSALTFNGHRIHYDYPYATSIEHYPALVVHGPLQAILLMQAARRHTPDRQVASFRYRATRPLLASDGCLVAGRRTTAGATEAFTATAERDVAMRGVVAWR